MNRRRPTSTDMSARSVGTDRAKPRLKSLMRAKPLGTRHKADAAEISVSYVADARPITQVRANPSLETGETRGCTCMIRLFAALAVPPEIGAALQARQHGIDGARWRPLEALHVTLRFF